jgi:FSR family fosmidomycin resistance protein-like MFS transporter
LAGKPTIFLRRSFVALSTPQKILFKEGREMRDLQKEDRLAIFSLSAGHFISDAYSNFLGPLLPLLVLKLKLSIAQAGWLAAMQVISSSLTQPAYGYLSDRYLKRLFAVFSPLVTVVFMSFLGVAPNYLTLALLLLCGGVGIASFHPQSAALASSASRHRKGLGMSIFVTSGTIGYSLGPVIITSAVATFGLERSYWVMVPGLLVFSLLYFSVPTTPHSTKVKENVNLKKAIKAVWYPLLILFLLVVIRSALQVCFVNFLPLYFSQKGATPAMAGKITTLFLFFGARGGFCGGAVADRLGGKNVIAWSMFFSKSFQKFGKNISGDQSNFFEFKKC